MKIRPFTIEQISRITGGLLHRGPAAVSADDCVSSVVTDSRQYESLPGSMFVAIKTRKNDGHRYIPGMYASGVRYFLLSEYLEEYALWKDAVFIEVPDTVKALQAWARANREDFDKTVVGITGSNGKTIVKEWLAYMAGLEAKVLRSPKSFNSQIGVPLSVLQLDRTYSQAIFEAGISQPGEMESLHDMIRPTVGIFTNIGPAHDADFANRRQKIDEKLKLFESAQWLLYCADHEDIRQAIRESAILNGVRIVSWTTRADIRADLRIVSVKTTEQKTHLSARYHGRDLEIEIPFTDAASVENAVHVWLYMLETACADDSIVRHIANLPPVAMRMEIKEGIGRSYVIDDAYNSDTRSLGMAVDFLCSRFGKQYKCLVFSDILQSGRKEEELYQEVAETLASRKIDRIVAIGDALLRQRERFREMPISFYRTTDDFLREFEPGDFAGKAVLLKGARCFAFERIGRLLQRQTHETVMEVNLSALVHNLNYFRSLIRPETKLMVMGKAFSYGSGSYEIADILEYNRVDYVTVAYPDEAITLRNNGIRIPILCMNCEEEGMESVLRYHVEPVIYNFRTLQHLKETLDRTGLGLPADSVSMPGDGLSSLSGSGYPSPEIRIHIALDTGMHRMGFEMQDLPLLFERLDADPRWKVQSVFTHLATADMPEMDVHTEKQLQCYTEMAAMFKVRYPWVIRHCLNTAGIFRYPEYQFEMVRLGIGLYGVGTDAEMQSHLETVSTLKTVISQVRTIAPGEGVGYGRRFIARRPTKVGVIGIGYADGLNRHLGNGRCHVWVKGKFVPIIGSICMDMCMLDLTDTDAAEKDEVEIFGLHNPIARIAGILDTIPYEVLTGISQRVKRVYIQE